MPKLKVGDYVVADKDINDVVRRSVGIVKEVPNEKITVFFIGMAISVVTDDDHVSYIDISKIGEKKEIKKKICNICHQLKEISEFDVNQTDAHGRKTTRPTCKQCRIKIDGSPLLSSEKKLLESKKPRGLFTCPICQKTSIVGVTANIVIDHDHVTGKGREWICDSCNTGLGRFKDSIELLQRAIDYLKKYS
jgi:RNase P subunit RPR2